MHNSISYNAPSSREGKECLKALKAAAEFREIVTEEDIAVNAQKLKVKDSSIKGAGLGLFTKAAIDKWEPICSYLGDISWMAEEVQLWLLMYCGCGFGCSCVGACTPWLYVWLCLWHARDCGDCRVVTHLIVALLACFYRLLSGVSDKNLTMSLSLSLPPDLAHDLAPCARHIKEYNTQYVYGVRVTHEKGEVWINAANSLNKARWANHGSAEDANMVFEEVNLNGCVTPILRAKRSIEAGEELLVDYGKDYWSENIACIKPPKQPLYDWGQTTTNVPGSAKFGTCSPLAYPCDDTEPKVDQGLEYLIVCLCLKPLIDPQSNKRKPLTQVCASRNTHKQTRKKQEEQTVVSKAKGDLPFFDICQAFLDSTCKPKALKCKKENSTPEVNAYHAEPETTEPEVDQGVEYMFVGLCLKPLIDPQSIKRRKTLTQVCASQNSHKETRKKQEEQTVASKAKGDLPFFDICQAFFDSTCKPKALKRKKENSNKPEVNAYYF